MTNQTWNKTEALKVAMRLAQHYVDGLTATHVAPQTNVAELRTRMAKPLAEEGLPAEDVVSELWSDAVPGLVGSASGRFFGWVIGGALPAAVAADWLTSVWDQNAALCACSPAAAVTEEIAGAWLKDVLRLPRQCSFAFVTGCQMAHVTCLAVARSALLHRHNWDVARLGLTGAPGIRILANEFCHASIERAACLLGFGQASIESLRTDEVGRVAPAGLRDSLARDNDRPTIVVLQAGDIATGAFDSFDDLIPIAHAANAWVHVDGAFGLWARASDRYRHLTEGCEQADSWATDGHKILNTPFDCGYAFVTHSDDHQSVFSLRASYLTHEVDARDQIDWNPEWSRRARGFPTYAALRSLGRRGVARLFENCCEQTLSLATGLSRLPHAELISTPIINQALVRFRDPSANASEADHDAHTDAVIEAVNATGEAFFTGCTWRNRRAMRISVCNWQTNPEDVGRAVNAARSILTSNEPIAKTGM